MGNIKAVIFDMDGVITETSEMHYMAWNRTAERLGVAFDKTFNESLKGISRQESLMKILEKGGLSFSGHQIEALMKDKNDHYVSLIQSFTSDNLNPGIYALMDFLKSQGIKIGIASASKSAPFLVKCLGIEAMVDHIVDPSSVPGKPAPDIFLAAADYFNLTPSECIGVEDATAGIQAIKRAGMYALGIGDFKTLSQADQVFETTEGLLPFFQEFLSQ